MKKSILIATAITASVFGTSNIVNAQDTTKTATTQIVKQDSTKSGGDLLGVITANKDYSTFTKIVNHAKIQSELQASGDYTVFAPINQGFVKLSQARLDSVVKDSSRLKDVLNYHVVKGKYAKSDILKALAAGKNTAKLTTVEGGTLTLTVNEQKNLEITDEQGNTALVTAFDQTASNGVIHAINGVLMPK